MRKVMNDDASVLPIVYFRVMKSLKWLWITSLVALIGYSIYDYTQKGFSWETIVHLVILVSGGVGLFCKK
jgi:hypothetical protein